MKKPKNVALLSNDITSAYYNYTAAEIDVFLVLVAEIDPQNAHKDIEYSISKSELEALTGRKWDYQSMYDVFIKGLMHKPFKIKELNKYTGVVEQVHLPIFTEIRWVKGNALFKYHINKRNIHRLINLKEKFTSVEIKPIMTLKSKYGKRIFLAISKFVRLKTSEIYSFKELRNELDLEDGQHTMTSSIKRHVLDVGINDINRLPNLKVDYQLIKEGRRYTGVRFIVLEYEKERVIDLTLRKEQVIQKNEILSDTNLTPEESYLIVRDDSKLVTYRSVKSDMKKIGEKSNGYEFLRTLYLEEAKGAKGIKQAFTNVLRVRFGFEE